MKTWTTIRDKIWEQAVIEAKSSIKIKRILENKLDLAGNYHNITINNTNILVDTYNIQYILYTCIVNIA